ncbi:MAG: ion transporter, partial [Myxococcales bacterium]|nr:ion transporter [Myxococcales bacterium]
MHSLREKLYVVIFEHDTRAGKAFDLALLWGVLLSVVVVIAESVDGVREGYGPVLRGVEWFFTVVFSIEYLLRIYSARNRFGYALSFFGLVDFLAVTPTFVALLAPGALSLVVVRVLRLLRVFRVLKLASFHGEGDALLRALRASGPKIVVFLGAVLSIVVIVGSAMYVIEGPKHGFTNIPRSMYWAIVTLTTVGYGDIAPQTATGQVLASTLMILGYAIIAVPTGIVSAEMSRATQQEAIQCDACGAAESRADARYCRRCGSTLE